MLLTDLGKAWCENNVLGAVFRSSNSDTRSQNLRQHSWVSLLFPTPITVYNKTFGNDQ